jgi:hypothetical protein
MLGGMEWQVNENGGLADVKKGLFLQHRDVIC